MTPDRPGTTTGQGDANDAADSAIAVWFLTPDERGNRSTRIDRRRRAEPAAYTDGNQVTVLVDGRAYYRRLLAELDAASSGSVVHFTDCSIVSPTSGTQSARAKPGSGWPA